MYIITIKNIYGDAKMIEIKMTSDGRLCEEEICLPDECGNPSGHITDTTWYISSAADADINIYEIYWQPLGDCILSEADFVRKVTGGYDWEHPTAIICN